MMSMMIVVMIMELMIVDNGVVDDDENDIHEYSQDRKWIEESLHCR